jgi:hypothetical protein
MSRRDEYKKYLKSPQWREQREVALTRSDGFCQFCGDFAANVHHAKYPKRFGLEHPHNLIPVCKRCHDLSHGIQKMKTLTDVTFLKDISPTGSLFNYLFNGTRVYASAESWTRALQVPKGMQGWFEAGLPRTALLKKDMAGGEMEMTYANTPVYRWHVVAELLRTFDRQWHNHEFKQRGRNEQYEIQKFHEKYDQLTTWGYDLQERALSNALNSRTEPAAAVSQETLIEALRQAVAPRLRDHDNKFREQDIVIAEIKDAVPALRDQGEYISVRQAILELGYDPTVMPLKDSRENLSGLTGRMLTERRAEKGEPVKARLDGQSVTAAMNTYRRGDIHVVLMEIVRSKQGGLPLA